MQLFAVDPKLGTVAATQAQEGRDYQCRDCGRSVRVRGGSRRRKHFYHSHGGPPCRQQGKSLQHLQVQKFLQSQLSGAQLEVSFSHLGRIADVLWPEQGLVFEVQCSPISLKEVMERNRDYESEGLQVVWILHEKRYNQGKCGEAEAYLKGLGCLYTDIDAEGRGRIYDQWDFIFEGRRWDRSSSYTVDLAQVLEKTETFPGALPASLRQRCIPHFHGDALDQALHDAEKAREWGDREAELHRRLQKKSRSWNFGLIKLRACLLVLYRFVIEVHAE